MVLYAFNGEISRAPWMVSEPLIAEMRLQWWADAVGEIYEATPRRHEVVDALAETVRAHDLPRETLDRMIAARRLDIYKERFADWAGVEAYVDHTAADLMELAARVLGAGTGAPTARSFGRGDGIARFLRALPDLEAAGWHAMPEGQTTEAAAASGRAAIALARQGRRGYPRGAVAALLPGVSADRQLTRIAQGGDGAISEFSRRWDRLKAMSLGRW